jgi:lysine-specific demethylase 8
MKKRNLNTIDTININNLDAKNFDQLFLSKNRPVIITNIFDTIPSISKWNPEYLVDILGNKEIRVRTSKNGIFTADPNGRNLPPSKMGFSDFMNKIKELNSSEKMYMQQLSLFEYFPELKDDFLLPNLIDDSKINDVNLWIGPGGNTSQLHYDSENNFLIQVYGEKKITLYNPKDFYKLYPNSCFSKASHITSASDIFDTEKYPKILKAKGFDITIGRGEMLYIPAYWWHLVYSINTSISVNVWWDNKLFQYFVPGAIHNFVSEIYNRCFSKK